jgi:hypothetical protein
MRIILVVREADRDYDLIMPCGTVTAKKRSAAETTRRVLAPAAVARARGPSSSTTGRGTSLPGLMTWPVAACARSIGGRGPAQFVFRNGNIFNKYFI